MMMPETPQPTTPQENPLHMRRGQKIYEGGDGWINWIVFPATMTDEEAAQASGLCIESGDAGQYFAHTPMLWRAGSRILITQFAGIDV